MITPLPSPPSCCGIAILASDIFPAMGLTIATPVACHVEAPVFSHHPVTRHHRHLLSMKQRRPSTPHSSCRGLGHYLPIELQSDATLSRSATSAADANPSFFSLGRRELPTPCATVRALLTQTVTQVRHAAAFVLTECIPLPPPRLACAAPCPGVAASRYLSLCSTALARDSGVG